MHQASATREIYAPKDAVWGVLDDFGGVEKYSPGVDRSGIVDGPETGMGAVRECHLDEGFRIEEEIIEYEPESFYTVQFTDFGDLPMKESYATMSVEAVDDSRTKVTMKSRFTPKFGPAGWLLAKLMMTSKLEEGFAETLESLEAFVTDEPGAVEGQSIEAPTD